MQQAAGDGSGRFLRIGAGMRLLPELLPARPVGDLPIPLPPARRFRAFRRKYGIKSVR